MYFGDLIIDLLATLQHTATFVADRGLPDGVNLALGPGGFELVAVLLVVVGRAHDFLLLETGASNCRLYSVEGVLSAGETRNVLAGGFRVVIGLFFATESSELLVREGLNGLLGSWLLWRVRF